MNCKNCGLPIKKSVLTISGYKHRMTEKVNFEARTCEHANNDVGNPKYKLPFGTQQYGQICEYMLAESDGTPDSEPAAPAEIVFQPKAQSGIAVEETGRKFRITP